MLIILSVCFISLSGLSMKILLPWKTFMKAQITCTWSCNCKYLFKLMSVDQGLSIQMLKGPAGKITWCSGPGKTVGSDKGCGTLEMCVPNWRQLAEHRRQQPHLVSPVVAGLDWKSEVSTMWLDAIIAESAYNDCFLFNVQGPNVASWKHVCGPTVTYTLPLSLRGTLTFVLISRAAGRGSRRWQLCAMSLPSAPLLPDKHTWLNGSSCQNKKV